MVLALGKEWENGLWIGDLGGLHFDELGSRTAFSRSFPFEIPLIIALSGDLET